MIRIFWASIVCGVLAGGALAQGVAPTPVPTAPFSLEDFFRKPAFGNLTLSPSGRYLAYTVAVDGRDQLAVLDLETRKAQRLTDWEVDVVDITWVGDERLVLSYGWRMDRDEPWTLSSPNKGGLVMVARDGKSGRQLWTEGNRGENLSVLRTIPDNDTEVIAVGRIRDDWTILDLFRLNVVTGERKPITKQPPRFTLSWLLDGELAARVATSWIEDENGYVVHYRKDEDSPWTELARNDGSGPTLEPLAFEPDNKTLLVAYNGGRDTMAIYRYDPDTKTLGELIAQHPRYDMGADVAGGRTGGVMTERKSRRILGFRVDAQRPQVVWIDPDYAVIQRTLDQALPGTINNFVRAGDSSRFLVASYSDRQKARWYLYDQAQRRIEELFDAAPWLRPEQLVEQKPFLFKTRDGLEIPGYVFLPKDRKPGEKLPTVVHIHGGPHARADKWGGGFGWIEGQVLASRGYAVVVPNFRVTPGLGGKIYDSGLGTLGRQMLDDHEDAAKWAIAEGIADPQRICASGASYGGYASLMVLARYPEVFKCAVAGAIVSDWARMVTSYRGDVVHSKSGVEFFTTGLIGVKTAADIPKDISPRYLANKIKQPVLLYAGEDDVRTPLEQMNLMIDALEDAGNPPRDVIVKEKEGHGFGREENNIDLYRRILKFLDQSIGPAAAATAVH